MKKLLYASLIFLFACDGDNEEIRVNNLTDGAAFVEEINLARNALAEGEASWNAYVIEVIEPTLEYLYGSDRYLERIDPTTNTNLYLELKNVYINGQVLGSSNGYTASIPENSFKDVLPLAHDEKLSSGSKKWVEYFLAQEVSGYHADFSGSINVSEEDEKGNYEVVAPEYERYNTARAAVVAWLYDSGNLNRGHRIILLKPTVRRAGGYVNTERGGATARLAN